MWLLSLMILIMPFEKSPYLKLSESLLGIFPEFTIVKVLGLVGLVWVSVHVGLSRTRLGLLDSAPGKAYGVFLLVVLLAGLVSGTGLQAVTRYLSLVLFFPIVLLAVRSERDVGRILWLCMGTMVLVFPYGYRQMLRYGGRMGVGLSEPNYFSLALLLLIPVALVMAYQQYKETNRVWGFAGAGVLISSLILASSRGAFLGFVLSMWLLPLKLSRRPWLISSLAVVAVLVGILVVPNSLGRRFLGGASLTVSGQNIAEVRSNEAHLDLLMAGLLMIEDHPFFGVGLGNFKKMSRVYYEVTKARIAHNTYLQIAAESGLPALVAFVIFLLHVFRSLGRSARLALVRGRPDVHGWALAMQTGLAAFLLSAFFVNAQFEKFFWLMIFLSIALEQVMLAAADPPKDPLMKEEPAWARWQLSGSSGVR